MSWFSPFRENDLRLQLQAHEEKLVEEVRNADDDYVLSVGEAQYLEHLVAEYRVHPLELFVDDVSVSTAEEMISAERFPSVSFNVRPGERYAKPVYTFHVPFEGDAGLFRSRASTYSMGSYPEIRVTHGKLAFKHIAFSDDVDGVKRAMEDGLERLRRGVEFIRNDVDAHNARLPGHAEAVLRARKDELLKRRDLTASLGVPVRTKSTTTPTVSVRPPESVKPRGSRPPASSPGEYTPEPTLDVDAYRNILADIRAFGVSMERSPGTYAPHGEEQLRDMFITHLTPRVTGTTTGETFNKSGKTDILIRHENRNVFVAELGIWGGPKTFSAKIDQMLGYLTWRDSKAALVMFVPNKGFSPIIERAESALRGHGTYVKHVGSPEDGWSNHILQLPNDPGREVQVALMLFHLPR